MTDTSDSAEERATTAGADYARRLQRLSGRRWKKVIDVQAPYRWNVGRLGLGYTLDIGCGIGRNLGHLHGNGVGVDHNAESVAVARSHGFTAYTVDEFFASDRAVPQGFDSLLVAHVVEHMTEPDAIAMLQSYLPYLKPGGLLCCITPQEAGYRTDDTHVRFVDFDAARAIAEHLGLHVTRQFSFPFPRVLGKFFRYNEFVLVAQAAQQA